MTEEETQIKRFFRNKISGIRKKLKILDDGTINRLEYEQNDIDLYSKTERDIYNFQIDNIQDLNQLKSNFFKIPKLNEWEDIYKDQRYTSLAFKLYRTREATENLLKINFKRIRLIRESNILSNLNVQDTIHYNNHINSIKLEIIDVLREYNKINLLIQARGGPVS